MLDRTVTHSTRRLSGFFWPFLAFERDVRQALGVYCDDLGKLHKASTAGRNAAK
jgi:hypothetical protein